MFHKILRRNFGFEQIAITTVGTMLTILMMGYCGYSLIKSNAIERFPSAISGAVVTLAGIGMVFWGW